MCLLMWYFPGTIHSIGPSQSIALFPTYTVWKQGLSEVCSYKTALTTSLGSSKGLGVKPWKVSYLSSLIGSQLQATWGNDKMEKKWEKRQGWKRKRMWSALPRGDSFCRSSVQCCFLKMRTIIFINVKVVTVDSYPLCIVSFKWLLSKPY